MSQYVQVVTVSMVLYHSSWLSCCHDNDCILYCMFRLLLSVWFPAEVLHVTIVSWKLKDYLIRYSWHCRCFIAFNLSNCFRNCLLQMTFEASSSCVQLFMWASVLGLNLCMLQATITLFPKRSTGLGREELERPLCPRVLRPSNGKSLVVMGVLEILLRDLR